MFIQIERLKELIKSYTITATVAQATGSQKNANAANAILDEINNLRLALAIDAEMKEIFYAQLDIETDKHSYYFSKDDNAFSIKQGIAYLENGVSISMLNQGERMKTITREKCAWQQLFSSVQSLALGQQTVFDLPETLRFGANQSLNFNIYEQTQAGYLFLAGFTHKDYLDNASKLDLQSEFINENGQTKYLPETQIVPIRFTFPSNVAGTNATAPNGNEKIYTLKNERSVLLTRVSTTATKCRISKLIDTARNQVVAENIEMAGVASDTSNPYTTYYDLPNTHLLREGSRLQAVIENGSVMTGDTQDADILHTLAFEAITL